MKTEKTSKSRRQFLKHSLQSIAKASKEELAQYSRQVDYDSLFDAFAKEAMGYGRVLITPPYMPGKMYELYEQSAMLSACVRAYVDNIDGYGYDIVSTVSDDDNVQTEENAQVRELKCFFDEPNDVESLKSLREKLRRDLEITGNAYLEVVRGRDGKPVMLFWVDAKRVRISTTLEPVEVPVTLTRAGQQITVMAEKYFRSYCMLTSEGGATGPRARYFRQYGDIRTMNAENGEFEETPAIAATEIIHFKLGNDIYGIPRWIGALMSVLGSWKSNLVNYDLFDSQGIPPMIISVTGGMLTDDSYEDLVNLFRKAKGAANFHKLLVLEAESTSGSIDGKDTAPKIDIKNMTEYRKEDAMFLSYLEYCNNDIQKYGFRLPGMFIGISDDANFATAFIVRQTAEEQLFIPERARFDEIINKTLVRDFGVTDLAFKSNGPVLQSTENLPEIVNLLAQHGALTVNGLIAFVNQHFCTDIALYEEEWADQPLGKSQEPEQPQISPADEREILKAVEDSDKTAEALDRLSVEIRKYASSGCGCERHLH